MSKDNAHPILGRQIQAETEEEMIYAESSILRDEVKPLIESDEEDWLPDWFLGKSNELDNLERSLKDNMKAMIHQIQARRKALFWRFGALFESLVRSRIVKEGGKRKSILLPTGKAGFRTAKTTIVVTDVDALIKWFEQQPEEIRSVVQDCFDIKFARKTPLIEYFDLYGEIPPGCDLIAEHEKFYPACELPQLPSPNEVRYDD